MTRLRMLVTALLTLALVAGCSSGSKHNQVPRAWITDRYEYSSRSLYHSSASPRTTANEIEKHRSARDRTSKNGKVFLRYRSDVVAISPIVNGSEIEITTYERAHQRWNTYIGNVWPSPGNSGGSFRGGGPGTGK